MFGEHNNQTMAQYYTTFEVLQRLGITPQDKKTWRSRQSRLNQLRRGHLATKKTTRADGTISVWQKQVAPFLVEHEDWIDRGGKVILFTNKGMKKILNYYADSL